MDVIRRNAPTNREIANKMKGDFERFRDLVDFSTSISSSLIRSIDDILANPQDAKLNFSFADDTRSMAKSIGGSMDTITQLLERQVYMEIERMAEFVIDLIDGASNLDGDAGN